ncbi:MAG: molybdopterin-dependent oxidoreductase, partial [Desulfobulbaceae bacterium]|nr:molybdopterin-dependent oxidoreductase [Desulfobulbaceae bacterium]
DRYGRQVIGGSYGTPDGWDDLRVAGTAARYLLTAAAASEWGVSPADCVAEKGSILHKASGKSRRYESLLEVAASIPVPKVSDLKLKSRPSEFKLLGTFIPGVDNPKILTGQPLFGCDVRLDGMLYAVFEKCPTYGGRVRNANVEQIRDLPGVTHAFVVDGTDNLSGLLPGVAIVAETWWEAQSARKKLRVDWETGHSDSTAEYDRQAQALGKEAGKILRSDGDVDRAFGSARNIIEASYHYPFVAHANMEPQNCTAIFHDSGKLELWAPSQNPKSGRSLIASTLGIPEDRIHVNLTRIGGGFGRRLRSDFMVEAAWIARETGRPVQLQWSREDDMRHDFYRPAAWHHFKAGIDKSGKMIAFDHHFVTVGADGETASGAGLSSNHYPAGLVPNFRLRQSIVEINVPTGPWRSPGHSAYCWVYQSFFDEVALAAGRDQLEFRLDLLSRSYGKPPLDLKRTSDTLKLAAAKAGWGRRKLKAKRGLGVAFHYDHGGFVSHVAQVVADGSDIKVEKVYSAVDVGPIINLSGAKNQVEGSVVDALSTAQLEITFANGAARQRNFDDYELLRIDQAPEVECHFIQSDNSPTGLGEPPIAAATPAITNAIFAATGTRIRELPFKRSGISA